MIEDAVLGNFRSVMIDLQILGDDSDIRSISNVSSSSFTDHIRLMLDSTETEWWLDRS